MPLPRRRPELGSLYDELEERDRLNGLITTGTNVLTKHLFGRLKTQAAANAITFNMQMEVESHFLGFRIGIPNIHTAAVTGVKACVGVAASAPITNNFQVFTQPDQNEWIDVTWGGAASVDLPSRAAEEIYSMAWSDMVYLPSIPRNDGGSRPLVCVRIEFPAGSTLSTPFNDVYGWRGLGSARFFRCSNQEVQGVTTKTSFTQNNVVSSGGDTKSVVPAIQYSSITRGHQLMIGGDSIQEGLGADARDYGYIQRAAYEASTMAKPIEYFNAGLHAQVPEVYERLVERHIEQVRPTILSYSPWSGNDVSASGITVAAMRRAKGNLGRLQAFLQSRGLRPLIVIPEAFPSVRSTGAGDQARRDYNAITLPSLTGVTILTGLASALTGSRDASGQDFLIPAATGDGTHLNEYGNNLAKVFPAAFLEHVAEYIQ